jgi:hypothetical protein
MVATAANIQEIGPDTVEKGQGALPGAVTAITPA